MANPSNEDIYLAVGRLEGKFDQYMELALPKRVSSLERSRTWVMGAAAAIGAGIAVMFQGTNS